MTHRRNRPSCGSDLASLRRSAGWGFPRPARAPWPGISATDRARPPPDFGQRASSRLIVPSRSRLRGPAPFRGNRSTRKRMADRLLMRVCSPQFIALNEHRTTAGSAVVICALNIGHDGPPEQLPSLPPLPNYKNECRCGKNFRDPKTAAASLLTPLIARNWHRTTAPPACARRGVCPKVRSRSRRSRRRSPRHITDGDGFFRVMRIAA